MTTFSLTMPETVAARAISGYSGMTLKTSGGTAAPAAGCVVRTESWAVDTTLPHTAMRATLARMCLSRGLLRFRRSYRLLQVTDSGALAAFAYPRAGV